MIAANSRSLRASLLVLAAVLALLAGGTWGIEKFAIDRLLSRDAVATGLTWARYLAQNVPDLEEVVNGHAPSSASLAFFERTREVGHVFSYKIFDPHGALRLIDDGSRAAMAGGDTIGAHNAAAWRALAAGQPFVIAKEGTRPGQPAFFSEAYVPVVVNGRTIAFVEAYVDQAERRDLFTATLTLAAVALSLLTALAFCIPAVAWYRRSREKQRADERIAFLAEHDALTGLVNRERLTALACEALAASAQHGGMVAVHDLSIDGFDDVNDTFGHHAGDALVVEIAGRLRAAVSDRDVVARLAGNEFVVLQVLSAPVQAQSLASRIAAVVAAPVIVDGHDVTVSASIGVALSPGDGDDGPRLMKSAGLALHRSRGEGGGSIHFFSPEMDVALRERRRIEKALRDALAHDRFELAYQPIVAMPAERLAGFEVLLRLRGPDGEPISPAMFIPVAEEIGLISRIGAKVLGAACRAAAAWPEHLKVAVNLSPAQFADGEVCRTVAAALEESTLAPHRLELEITEGLLLAGTEPVMAELRALKRLGVAIAMDDFGTGYSSLSYLWRFPFDKIKIDRSFMVAFDAGDANVETVIRTIVALGRSLAMTVTVEGVETARQVAFLRHAGCDQIQGYYFGRPMPASDVAAAILADFRRGHQVESVVQTAAG
jgi:diguanylate cyclase (GGDEF)-like protein